MLPLFAISCLRKAPVFKALESLEWARGQKFWMGCGCSRVVFVLPPPSRPCLGDGFPRLDKILLVDPVGVTGGDRA